MKILKIGLSILYFLICFFGLGTVGVLLGGSVTSNPQEGFGWEGGVLGVIFSILGIMFFNKTAIKIFGKWEV